MVASKSDEQEAANKIAEVIDAVTGKKVTVKVVPPGSIQDDGKGLIINSPDHAVEIMRETHKWPQSLKDWADENPAVKEILQDPTLSKHQRKLKILPFLKQARTQLAVKEKEINATEEKIKFANNIVAKKEEFDVWMGTAPKLSSNDCSRLHQLVGFLKAQYRVMPELNRGTNPNKFPWQDMNVFVVQHDWAAAFRNAGDYAEGGFNLPYEFCAFEFRISDKSVIMLSQQSDEQHIKHRLYVEVGNVWVSDEDNFDLDNFCAFSFVKEQIKAICVALDAEVATHNVMRVSEKVNRRREQEGREPFFSYHVVSLNRRFKVGNPSRGGGMQGKKRLHFRRGHWRHFAEFKTWVRWCLVGNPELGFIDKEYRL